jgi:hypothetical protein
MPNSIFVINEKGGVGKTVVSTALADYFLSTGAPYRILDADCQPGRNKRTCLSAMFSQAERFDIGVSVADLLKRPTLKISHWDALYELAKTDNLLVDFGANVAPDVLAWLKSTEIGRRLAPAGVTFDFVLVTTRQEDSVGDAANLVRRIRKLIPAESRRIFLMLNEKEGEFDSYADSPELAEFNALCDAGEMAMIALEKCGSEIWMECDKHRLPTTVAIAMPEKDLEGLFRMKDTEIGRGQGSLARWHRKLIKGCMVAGLLEDDGVPLPDDDEDDED